ncbi:hypothetical protein V6K52_06785 [Knoellia sp. S7-12]|uniref:hypothetical protein n=1 Tax=Knoellia sp. S7-12 TaxID=3126698 RepID=UPI00336926C7
MLRKGFDTHRFTSRLGAAIAMTAAIGLATATTAAAHECFNASRSDQGNLKAGSNSQAWFTLVVADAIAGDVEDGFLTPAQGACVTAAYAATGAPSSFTIKVIAGKTVLSAVPTTSTAMASTTRLRPTAKKSAAPTRYVAPAGLADPGLTAA